MTRSKEQWLKSGIQPDQQAGITVADGTDLPTVEVTEVRVGVRVKDDRGKTVVNERVVLLSKAIDALAAGTKSDLISILENQLGDPALYAEE